MPTSPKTKITWNHDALELLEKAPPFVVKMAKPFLEHETRKRGNSEVTAELIREFAGRFSPGRSSDSPFRLQDYYANETPEPLYGSFDPKTLTNDHGSKLGGGLSREEYQSAWATACGKFVPGETRALYVHTPFCSTRCKYCGFFVNGSNPKSLEKYTDYLVRELETARRDTEISGHSFDCIYLGGGTPSDLSTGCLERILKELRRFKLADDCEITLEGRISSLTPDKVQVCSEYGVNRYSLGVQTFHTGLRRAMGRVSSREEVIAALRRLAENEQTAVVIDLIYGFPGQTMEMWEDDLQALFREAPVAGVDHYQLIQMPGTPLYKAVKEGWLPAPPAPAMRADMYIRGVESMAANGARRISLKHFAMDGRERNIYNRLQAYNGSCVPFGCGGGGGFGGFFFYQGGSLERYYASMDAGRKPLTQVTPVTPDSTVLNRLAGDIRIGGVFNPARIQQETGHRGIPLPELFQPLLAQYESRGLLKSAPDGEIVLTPAGQFWHNAIIQNLTALFAYSRKQEKEIS